ncbi:hypothetical protein NQ314_001944 [Rhamnusium bicolor]|uniref:Uncharacterized protein n=1 Tax=Rhamnusium bicolor TaxID=1586634 RepID=A0AAV8ZS23_9CUCU|nr:hypothetical protein NQ314_001944 [Rhamnusium bicolor]
MTLISGMDSLFVSIMHCIAGNLTIIQGAFLTIRERSLKEIKGPALDADRLNNSECLNTAMNLEMRKVCKNLQTIFK